jgi:hypothetical protein
LPFKCNLQRYPAAFMKYQNDPEIMDLVTKLGGAWHVESSLPITHNL